MRQFSKKKTKKDVIDCEVQIVSQINLNDESSTKQFSKYIQHTYICFM